MTPTEAQIKKAREIVEHRQIENDSTGFIEIDDFYKLIKDVSDALAEESQINWPSEDSIMRAENEWYSKQTHCNEICSIGFRAGINWLKDRLQKNEPAPK